MKNLGDWLRLFKQFKNAPDIPHLTNALHSSETFRKACMKVHYFKLKIMEDLHKSAFGDQQANKTKQIDQKTKQQHTQHQHHSHHHKK